jgi:hypothetical protein
MTKAKGRHRREAGLPEISGAPEIPKTSPGVDEEPEFGEVEEFKAPLGDDDRVVVRLVTGMRGQLLDFALIQQVRDGGRWRDVVRYDCAHGEVHEDRYVKGRKGATKKEICHLGEIEDGYKYADKAVFDRWEENRRRYFNG